MKTTSFQRAFTLIELMVTVAVVAVVLTVAVPSIRDLTRNNRLATSANQLIGSLSFARSEAIKRGIRISVRKTSTNWESGWQVFTDASGTVGTFDGTDEVLRVNGTLPNNFTLRGNNNFVNYISFLPSGESNNMGAFAICDNSDGSGVPRKNASRLIVVNSIGRIRLATDTDGNGIPEKENSDGTVTNISSCTNP